MRDAVIHSPEIFYTTHLLSYLAMFRAILPDLIHGSDM